MLPPGHAAAGYLITAGILSLSHGSLEPAGNLLWLGALCGALPDLDMFAAFARTRSLVIENEKQSHRAYITHTPLFWVVMTLVMYLLTRDSTVSFIVLLAPLSHLFLDSLEDEIRWLGPWSNEGYSIFKRKKALAIPRQDFFSYWSKFLFWYIANRRLTAMLEAALIFLSIFLLSVEGS